MARNLPARARIDKILDVKLHIDAFTVNIYPREIDYVDKIADNRGISVVQKPESNGVECHVRVFAA